MATSKITLYGMASYCNNLGSDLFEFLLLPDMIDKDTFINSLMLRGGEFEVLYADPDYMRLQIGTFCKKNERTFNKWAEALNIEYAPLENYNRIETWHDATSGTGTGTNVNKVSAFNSTAMQNDSASNSNTDFNNTSDRNGVAKGNIGVTTSQQMLEAELNISAWNLYDHIIDLFLQEFVIPIY